ncbi:hypothetical protein CERZMDRAFT_119694 [Cercospora zeae-maydis SCOH1-5]|uniref:C2H2-type domain-containing protein n=1 Tax=Cercospora zeae-maydis SCOH1-5 TaxID=717836 RepID=A0A6A6FTZ5_9PEZI|nr:hypothetical protein CERZMDRAFT_119694 [Cercospora zeae-maydis SCOH1-5]
MAPYPHNNFYDPVGSQSHQPSGYTYANTSTQYPSQSTTYQNNAYSQNYGTSYDIQYAGTAQQQQQQPSAGSTNVAAAGLSSLGNQSYSQPVSGATSRSNVAYDTSNSSWAQNYGSTSYHSTDRSQANQSPIYATPSAGSTFGRLSLPEQTQPNTYAASQTYQTTSSTPNAQSSSSGNRSYRNAPDSAGHRNSYQPQQDQQSQQPPPRYASPLQAMQAHQQQQQQHQPCHNKQPSLTSNHAQPSPRLAAQNLQQQRQQRASVEPMPTTVDPSQVYDIRAEREKAARIEAEKRRKYEAEQAAKKAEEDARSAEEDARKAEEERIATEAHQAEEDTRKASEAEAKKMATAERKKEARRKAKEEKQSKTAATALQQMASGSGGGGSMMDLMGNMSGPPANDEEAEMRAMFKKMREFNQKNPTMLAKLWEEERKQHAAQTSPGPSQPARPVQNSTPQPAAPTLTKTQQKAPVSATALPAQPSLQSANRPAQPSPTTPGSAGTALWPPQKKGTLAEAAATWLSALPANQSSGRVVNREQILKILDTNPSYVQLCEAIERTGIYFERSALAKELLKAVPDGLKGGQSGVKAGANAAPSAASTIAPSSNGTPATAPPKKKGRPKKDEPGRYSLPGGRGSTSGTVSYSAPTFTSLTDAARAVNAMNTTGGIFQGTVSNSLVNAYVPATQDPTFYDATPIMIDDDPQPSTSQPAEIKPEEKPKEPPPPPKDKEEAARKRGFGDLVDLTAGDSDDEAPPRKLVVPSSGPGMGVKAIPSNDALRQPISYQQFVQNKSQQSRPLFGAGFTFGTPGPSFSSSGRTFPQQTWNGPKTQSPAPPAPVPAPQQARPKGPSEETKQAERIRGRMLVEPIMRDRVARKSKYDSRTIARDVLLATGRHPDMRALNAHLNVMQKLLSDHGGVVDGGDRGNKSDLSTIRWDLIDPGDPTEEAKIKARSASNREGDVEDGGSALHAKRKSEGAEPRDHVPNPKKPRGRPPKNADRESSVRDASLGTASANKHPELTSDLSPRISRTTPVARRGSVASNYTPKTGVSGGRKSSSMSKAASVQPTGTPVGYAAFRQLDEDGNPIKKKGRPVGWRKNIHSREAQGLTPKKTAANEPKTTSKLRQSTATRESSEVIVEPHYQIFPCKWRNCNAELDNLEKLKKHMLKLHGDANDDGDFECQWQTCGNGVHIDAHGNERPGDAGVTSFETLDSWFKHVNKSHLHEIAWKLGDGPRGGSVSEIRNDRSAYLSDASGRSVTPIILTPQELAQQRAEAKAEAAAEDKGDIQSSPSMAPTKLKRKPGRPAKSQGPFAIQSTSLDRAERDAAAELMKLEEQKRREGVTMGLEGSRLVNEKRRRGFLDDEDFEDIIEDSEPDL